MNYYSNILLIIIITIAACTTQPKSDPNIFLGQGIMVGEVSDQSVLLQTRLTASDTLRDRDVPGQTGLLRFKLSKNAEMQSIAVQSDWLQAKAEHDFILKFKAEDLQANQTYYYQAFYGEDTSQVKQSRIGSFRTNAGADIAADISFAVVTGMNYYHFHYGRYNKELQYQGDDKELGYPALSSIQALAPDYFIGTGDNVYFDHPAQRGMDAAKRNGREPLGGLFDGKEVTDEAGMRQKYHVQFVQQRYKDLFSQVGAYWEKDDHDYRVNDADPYMDFPISHELGIKNFKEQLPLTTFEEFDKPTYRTFRLSNDAQIWLLEGRDYRSANSDPDGPAKTIWGAEQKAWLQQTLLESTATFKFIISPTPMVGPDDAYKKDNHVNPQGFKYEGDAFFKWLGDNGFLEKNLYLICGDRHWQYHATHPSGFEEFSSGALVDANSRAGRLAGDPKSTDPDALIKQHYIQGTAEQASGGFLLVGVKRVDGQAQASFSFYDEKGKLNYEEVKQPT